MAAKKTKTKAPATKKAPPAPHPVLRWLKIHQFRHVEPCELHFSDGYNVLLGLNGTGKTTLLELISAALRFDFSKMKDEVFFLEYELRTHGDIVTASVRNVELSAARSAGNKEPRAITMRQKEQTYEPSVEIFVVSDQKIPVLKVSVAESGSALALPQETIRSEKLRSHAIYGRYFLLDLLDEAEGLGGKANTVVGNLFLDWIDVCRFDESLGFLQAITDESTGFKVRKGAKKIADNERLIARGLVPASVRKELLHQTSSWTDSTDAGVVVAQDRVGLLSQMAAVLGFENIELRFSHINTEVKNSVETRFYGEPRFMLTRSDGAVISHTLLSYGQKRALAFLYYLALNEHTVIADELVDGLHHSWIEQAVEAIGKRQTFLASQNPLLLDYLEFDSAEKVRNSFIQCHLVKAKGKKGERMTWGNLSAYDAGRFYDAYQVGLQHVSEILRTKGLW